MLVYNWLVDETTTFFICWSFEEVTVVAGKGRSPSPSGIAKTSDKNDDDDVRCRVTVLGKVGSCRLNSVSYQSREKEISI